MLEPHQSFKSKWKGRYSNESDAAVGRSNYKNFLTGLTDRGELLSNVLNITSHAFTSLNVKKSKRTGIGSNNDQFTLHIILKSSHFNVLLEVDGSYNLKWLFSLSAYANLIVKSTADEYVHFALKLLSGNKMGHLSSMSCQVFHLCAICSIIQSYVSLGITDDHPFSEKIEIKSRNLEWSDIHIYLLYVAVESTPYLDLISRGSEETECIFNVSACHHCILICCKRVVIFVVIIKPHVLSPEDQS